METAAPVEIEKVAFGDIFLMISTAAWKSRKERSAFPQFPQPHGDQSTKQQTTKPDISLATKTGHFYLLLTDFYSAQIFAKETHDTTLASPGPLGDVGSDSFRDLLKDGANH